MTTNISKRDVIIWGSAGLIVAVGGYFTINAIVKSGMYKKVLAAINDVGNIGGSYSDLQGSGAFNVNYWKNAKKGAKLLTSNQAQDYAKRIYDAKGGALGVDNEKEVVAIFRGLRSKAEVSMISWAFNIKYPEKGGLYSYLESFMENTTAGGYVSYGSNYMEQVNDIVKQLPNY